MGLKLRKMVSGSEIQEKSRAKSQEHPFYGNEETLCFPKANK